MSSYVVPAPRLSMYARVLWVAAAAIARTTKRSPCSEERGASGCQRHRRHAQGASATLYWQSSASASAQKSCGVLEGDVPNP